MALSGIAAPPSAFYPPAELFVSLLRLNRAPGSRRPQRPPWNGEWRETPCGEARKGLVQVLKGALLPSGAGAWLLGAEEARGPWPQEGFGVLYTKWAPWFLPVCENGRVSGFGWARASRKTRERMGSPGHSSGPRQAQVTGSSQLCP